tara:strand:+ start:522 stop:1847 length:1326 start_codon:yes stop_codon:yes gene_type:complete
MKLLKNYFFLLFLIGCSFDNKSGIWNSGNLNKTEKNKVFSDFKTLSSKNDRFENIVPFDGSSILSFSDEVNNRDWNDIYYGKNNNFENFNYRNLNDLIFRSKKITKEETNNYILLKNNIIIINTKKGDLIFYSLNENKILNKFNFYKKRYKKIEKKLNIIIQNDIIYVSDNLGYLYSLKYNSNKIIWAKNYKIPFRSNLKIIGNKLVAANQNNILYFFDKKNGETLKMLPTEETIVKNKFQNNISIDNDHTFFLNTYGSLYSIDNKSMRIKWFINLNQSNDLNPSNLFQSNQIISYKRKLIVSTNNYTYVLNEDNGSILHKKNFSSHIKPLVNNNNVFLITKNNLLLSFNLLSGKILYSYDINKLISEFLNINKKKADFKTMMIAKNQINIFLKNSFVLKLDINGKIIKVLKLPTKIKSYPIFSNNNLIYIDKKNKLSVVN